MRLLKIGFFLLCVFIAVDVHAQSSQELKRRRDILTQQLDQLNREYEQTANNKRATLKQLSVLKQQINIREEKINNINSEVRNLDNQISESTNTVHSLQSQLDLLKKEYAAMVLFAYRNQSSYNKMMFIFAAKDFNQAYKRLKYLQQIGNYRQRQAGYIQETQKNLHVKINELDKTKKEKNNLLKDQQKEKATLGKEKNDQVKVVVDLSKHQGQLKQQQRELQARKAKTDRELTAAIRREIEEARRKAEEEARAAARAKAENKEAPVKVKATPKKLSTSEVLNATPEAARLSNDFLGNRGRLPWPVSNGTLVQGFGVYYSEGIKNDNDGWDIRTNTGGPVRAVFEGEVKRISNISGTFMVVILHGEYFTAYANLKSVNVKVGQKVSTKQNIGAAATDSSTGEATVQFKLYKGSTAVNPKIWLAPN
ncbi:peptidoglycan DD-metalloendopeptidase family protein [soil metagenome]